MFLPILDYIINTLATFTSGAGNSKRVAVIGGGWFGTHTALRLSDAGYSVTIYEKNEEIFRGISGDFGIRLHKGPHYPRSRRTREDCLYGLKRFAQEYPELIIDHDRSIYALGKKDALGLKSKTDVPDFHACCHEAPHCETIDAAEFGDNVETAYELNEPSIFLGTRLRLFFQKRLTEKGVKVITGVKVTNIPSDHVIRESRGIATKFNYVVNATSFKDCLPDSILTDLPIDIQVSYQPCIALLYEDQIPQE
ncbi:hypothetical protein MMC10_010318 [Thelotrema lepadinum]|nr:hypothetical protein [Thelotrema lepadinum]